MHRSILFPLGCALRRAAPACLALLAAGSGAGCDGTSTAPSRFQPAAVVSASAPSQVPSGQAVWVRFEWAGGGCIRSIDHVGVIHRGTGGVDLYPRVRTPDPGVACPADAFIGRDSTIVSGLPDGTHTLRVHGAQRAFELAVVVGPGAAGSTAGPAR